LVQQRAQEQIILQAIPAAEEELRLLGHPGRIGLLRNARDIEGNIYGPQENYEVIAGSPWMLRIYRLGLGLLCVPLVLVTLALWVAIIGVMLIALALMIVFMIIDGLLGLLTSTSAPMRAAIADRGLNWWFLFGWLEIILQNSLVWPVIIPYSWMVRVLLFRQQRRGMMSFLVSRPVITGTGTLLDDGSFALSEKAPGIGRVHRWSLAMAGHSIFDSGNLLKGILSPALADLRSFTALFNGRLRMQLGLSDGNRLDVAEYLKVGMTVLVIDMAEAGALEDAPLVKSPVSALHRISADPSLTTQVDLKGGGTCTALELQRWYLERAELFVKNLKTTSIEALDIIALWRETLDALADCPESLVGQIDWVTKRYLLEAAADDLSLAARKKVDLKYHELGVGYADRLREQGFARPLVADEEVTFAMYQAPENSPAFARGRLIREWSEDESVSWVSWSSARLRQEGKSRIVRLDDFRSGGS